MARMLCPALVGRDAELQLMAQVMRVGGTLAIVGEPGVGKSRLVREFCDSARAEGVAVVIGRATGARRPMPYRPLAEALIAACRQVGLPDAPELAPYRAALGRLLPEWRGTEGPGTGESPLVLAEGVLRLLHVLAGAGAGLLVVEDVHWADPETLDVLEYLADHATEERATVVLTSRPESSAGAGLVRDLADRRAATLVELAALSADEVATVARCALGARSLPAGLSEVLAAADGVPFLVEELLAAAVEAGALIPDGPGWILRPPAGTLVPASFTDSVRRRLRRLPPVGRELLELCALLGTRDASVLAAALERSTEEVVEVLGRAVDLQLMVADQTSFRFRHALTRDAILAGLPPDVRRLLARRARSAVEKIHPGLPGAWCRLAAELSRLSCEPAKAAALLVTAASRAVSDGALKTATDDLEQAWTLAPAGSSVALDVEELRTRVAGLAGDLDSAMEHAGRLLMQVVDPVRRARVHLQLAEAASAASRWTLAREELSAARPLVEDAGGLAAIDALTAQVMLGAAHVAEAETSAHRALEVSERLGLADPACQALEVLGRIQRNRDMHQAEDVFTRQLELASRHGAKLWELRAMHELGTIDLLHANETARLCRARELATDAGAVVTTATIDLQLGMSGWLRFDAATCVDRARRCQDAARRFRLELLLAEALLLEAAGHGFAGRRAAMELAITEARATGRPEADLEASAWAHRAGYSLFREDRTAAIAALDTAISILRDAETVYVRPYWRTWALLRTVEANDGDAARAEARRVMAGDSRLSAAIIGYGDAVAGGRSGAAGEAEELFELARASASAPGFTAQRHLAERLVAECALVDGWGRPTRWLAEAEVFFSSSDQPHVARACRSLLRRAGVPPVRRVCATPIPPVLAALGISAREADVLELISEGLTSRQVAERLFISVRTVDKHVERLLQKTGVTRRAELRAFRT